MIGGHPGGNSLTRRLLDLAEVFPPARVLDLGTGTGDTTRILRADGFDADGLDLVSDPRDPDRITGDMTALPFADASYDICLAECSISVCGDGPAALREARRVLRTGGKLLLSDVCFRKEQAPCLSMPGPLTFTCWEREILRAGFVIRAVQDESALWKEFFLQSLWNDNADETFCDLFREAGKAGCGYFLAWLEKGEEIGFI